MRQLGLARAGVVRYQWIMSPLRAIARPLLASVFIVDGWDAMRNPEKHAKKLERYEKPLASVSEQVPLVPKEMTTLARFGGAVSVGAGVLLATGKYSRLAASALALVAVPMTLADKSEHGDRSLSSTLRSAGLIGGLIFAAEDRRGKPSRSWRRQLEKEHRAELSDLKADLKADIKAAKAS